MKLLASSNGVKELTVNEGKVIARQKDGTFHVDGAQARLLKASGDFALVGTNFQGTQGYRCQDCGFHSVYRDHCGKCDGSNLVED
jgi:hypothetical protein